MDLWYEVRTAYAVARLGTVSAAAEALGLHRATVVRHVDTLEEELGGRLFQRHARGYTPTEAGHDLLRVASATDAQFEELARRTRGRRTEVSGEVIVTSIELVTPLVLPALRAFQDQHPDTEVRYTTSAQVLSLEYGEAHVGIRTGTTHHPDNVVQPWLVLHSGLYAHQDYVDRRGRPESRAELAEHSFVGDVRADSTHPTSRWLRALVDAPRMAFSSRDERTLFEAIEAGLGIGFVPEPLARARPGLVEVVAPRSLWDVPFSLVTHIDLHWTAKVQAVLGELKRVAEDAA